MIKPDVGAPIYAAVYSQALMVGLSADSADRLAQEAVIRYNIFVNQGMIMKKPV